MKSIALRAGRLVPALALVAVTAAGGCATERRSGALALDASVPDAVGAEAPSPSRAHAVAEPLASAANPAGRITGYQFARRYQDVVKTGSGTVSQMVEYGFDYDRRVTVRRIFTSDGTLVAEDLFEAESLHANPAESARVRELVETHPQLGPLMSRRDLLVHAGGFVVREPGDPYCDIGSRCLRFIVSTGDGSETVIHAIVDLVTDRVVYPFVKT